MSGLTLINNLFVPEPGFEEKMRLVLCEEENLFDKTEEGLWRKSDLGQETETEPDITCLDQLIEANNNKVIKEELTTADPDSSSEDSDSDATITNEAFPPCLDPFEKYEEYDDDEDEAEGSSEGEYIYEEDSDDDDGEDVGGGPTSEWTISTIQEEDEDEAEESEEDVASSSPTGAPELELESRIDPCSSVQAHEQTESRVSTRHYGLPNSPELRAEDESGTRACLSPLTNLDTAQHETTTCPLGSPQPDLTPELVVAVSEEPSSSLPELSTATATDSEREMHQTQRAHNSDIRLPRSVLRKPGHPKQRKGRCVTFNESLNLFYDAECSCWVHEDDYNRYRQEEYEYERAREEMYTYEPPPIPVEFEDPPTLSPPEGYKDRFFPQDLHIHHPNNPDPDVTRVSPPSPPAIKRKVFLKENPTAVNGQPPEEEHEEETKDKKKGLRLGGILKGGRLWRSNSSDGKKVISPPDEPDLVKCAEPSPSQSQPVQQQSQHTQSQYSQYDYSQPYEAPPGKVSIGTAPLRTSEQIRLAVDSTLRGRGRQVRKPECSTLVEKLRWLTSLDDDESSDSGQSGFATWPSRDKNGVIIPQSTKKSDAGTSTSDQETFVDSTGMIRSNMVHEARIKQIAYTLEDIEEGLNGNEVELETFVSADGGRIERIRKRYGEEGGDDYGFSRRPSVKGIRPKFSSTNQIFATFTSRRPAGESPSNNGGQIMSHTAEFPQEARMNILALEAQYENTRLPKSHEPPPQNQAQNQPSPHPQQPPVETVRALNYEFQNAPGRQTEESRAHFEMIRQSFESATAGAGPNFINSYNRPHSWSVSTLPHPHHNHGVGGVATQSQNGSGPGTPQQPIYGTVRRVPNVIGRPLFLHYGALSVEAHPNRIPIPPVNNSGGGPVPKVAETPSPTQQPPTLPAQPPGTRYYGPPIRYYNQPPPIPPRTVTAHQPSNNLSGNIVIPAPLPVGINNLNMPPHSGSGSANPSHPHVNVLMSMNGVERGVPEGATDEEPNHKEPYSMNV